jgi:hypothetical protein
MGSYAQGAQKAGSTPGDSRDSGFAIYAKAVDIQAGGQASADFTAYLPDGCEIVDILMDTVTAHTSASATLSVGTTLGGTEIAPATSVVSGGRVRPTFTAAQLTSMQSLVHTSGQSDTPVYLRLALGTPTSVGLTKAVLLFSPKL